MTGAGVARSGAGVLLVAGCRDYLVGSGLRGCAQRETECKDRERHLDVPPHATDIPFFLKLPHRFHHKCVEFPALKWQVSPADILAPMSALTLMTHVNDAAKLFTQRRLPARMWSTGSRFSMPYPPRKQRGRNRQPRQISQIEDEGKLKQRRQQKLLIVADGQFYRHASALATERCRR